MIETDIIREAGRRGLKPPPRLSVSQWADEKRILSPESSAEPGPWNTSRAPYQRGMMDAINDPAVEQIVIMSSAQVGKTEIINNMIGYFVDQDPSPIMMIMPTLEMGEAWSKDRLSPMIRDSPCLRDKVRDVKSRNSANTILHKTFPGGHITIAGANSPASLASRPIRIVCCDEVDKYNLSAGTEGDPISLVFKRTTTFWNRKMIITSTPGIKGVSRIEKAYLESDQRNFLVPCPHCEGMQQLLWRQLQWPPGRPEACFYTCIFCKRPIDELSKQRMLERGVWVPEGESGKVAGFHIMELYSPWVKWSEMAANFILAKKTVETLKAFVNSSLGETWEQEGESVDDGTLYGRREEYAAEVPEGVAVLTAGVDVQDDRIEVEVVGWGENEESWSIEYVTIPGNPAQPNVWRNLEVALSKVYTHELGVALRIVCALVDSGGHFTKEVYSFCAARSGRWVIACKGEAGAGKPLAGKIHKLRTGALLCPVGVDTAKELLWARLKMSDFGPGFCHFPKGREYDVEYFKQLTAEKITTKFKNGFPVKVWIKTRPRNEALDCRVYAMAALDLRRVDLKAALSNLKKRAEYVEPEPEPTIVGAIPEPRVKTPIKRANFTRNQFVNGWRG